MDYLKILHENPDLADEFDSLFDFFLLDELSPRDEADGRCTFSLPGMAFARDGSGGEYHLLEDGSIGYYSSEGEAGRLAESILHYCFPANHMLQETKSLQADKQHFRPTVKNRVCRTVSAAQATPGGSHTATAGAERQIGRASCRERV